MGYFIQMDHQGPTIISLADAKKQLKIDAAFDVDDDLIGECIDAAIQDSENYSNAHIAEAKFKLCNSEFVNDWLINKSPVQKIDAIKYFDTSGSEQTLDPSKYELIPVDSFQHKIVFPDFDNLPPVQENKSAAVTVEMTVGYADGKTPKAIKRAINMIMTDFYENREDRVHKLPTRATSILSKYRFYY